MELDSMNMIAENIDKSNNADLNPIQNLNDLFLELIEIV